MINPQPQYDKHIYRLQITFITLTSYSYNNCLYEAGGDSLSERHGALHMYSNKTYEKRI